MLGLIGLVLEAIGIIIILGSQAIFVSKARKRYGVWGLRFWRYKPQDFIWIKKKLKNQSKTNKSSRKLLKSSLMLDCCMMTLNLASLGL